jgi:hypothetical protein
MPKIVIIVLAGFMGVMLGCKKSETWSKALKKGDMSLVECGRGGYSQRQRALSKKEETLYAPAKRLLADNPDVFMKAIGHCSEDTLLTKDNIIFTAILGDDEGRVFLTYLAMYRKPKIMAGKRIQLVLSETQDLERVLVYDVPLE